MDRPQKAQKAQKKIHSDFLRLLRLFAANCSFVDSAFPGVVV